MKKKLFFLLLCLPVFLYSQKADDWKHTFTLSDQTNKLGCHDSLDCYVFTHYNDVFNSSTDMFKSFDKGKTWEKITSIPWFYLKTPEVRSLDLPLYFTSPNPSYYYISGFSSNNDQFLVSSDSGYTFSRVDVNLNIPSDFNLIPQMKDEHIGCTTVIDSFELYDNNTKIRAFYTFWVTFDGWKNYHSVEVPDTLKDRSLGLMDTLKDGRLRMITSAPLKRWILHYDILKNEWEIVSELIFPNPDGNYDNIQDFIFLNDSIGFAVGYRLSEFQYQYYDIIYKTSDGGRTYQKILDTLISENPAILTEISFYDEKNGIATGKKGKIWLTNDYGENWFLVENRKYFYKGDNYEGNYGPEKMYITWAGRTPLLATRPGGNIYRYEGDFFKFKDEAPPLYPPEGIFPADSSITHETDIKFQWSDVEEAENYLFRLSELPDLTNAIADVSTIESEFPVENLKRYTEYYWSIASVRGDEQQWSPVYTFRTKMQDVELVFPGCDSVNQERDMNIKWKAVNGAEYYRFRMSEYEDFSELSVSVDSLGTNSIGMTGLKYATTYYWQVQAYNSVESSEWSEVCSFTVKNPSSVRENTSKFRIYPNPANNTLYIDGINFNYGLEYQISDNNGKLLLSGTLRETEINIKSLSTGVYYINIKINDVLYKDKFVKE